MLKVVAAVIYDEHDLIYIAKRNNNATLANLWEFPGGKVEAGETKEQALIREMQEECGVDVKVEELLDNTQHHYPEFSVDLYIYKCSVVSGTLNSIVHQEQRFVEIKDLSNYEFAPADTGVIEKIQKKLEK